MRTKKEILIAGLIAMFMLIAACSDDNQPTPPIDGKEPALAGTKWELIKLQNTDKNIERSIFVGDDVGTRYVPIMQFETDTTGIIEMFHNNPPFNINKQPLFQMYSGSGGDNIMEFMTSIALSITSYKIEDNDTLLKFYHKPDGFYWDNGDGVIQEMKSYTIEVDGQWITMKTTDSNAYNCTIFRKVKQ